MSSVQGTASQVLVNNTSGSPVGGAITLTLPSAVVISSTLTSGGIIVTGGATSGSAGQGIFSGNSTYGAIIGGSGGTYDVTLSNNAPSIVMGIPTGTLNVSFLGGVGVTGAITGASFNGLKITTSTGTLTVSGSKTLTVSNTLTLAGTDSTTMTFPTTSASIARTDAGQTFTGTQIFTTISAPPSTDLTLNAGSGANNNIVLTPAGTGGVVISSIKIWQNVTPSANNYVLESNGSNVFLNAPSAGQIGFSIGNGASVFNISNVVQVIATTDQSGASTGSFQTAGGAYIAKSLLVGTTIATSGSAYVGSSSIVSDGRLSITYTSANQDAIAISNTNGAGRTWVLGDSAGSTSLGTFCIRDVTGAANALILTATGINSTAIGATTPSAGNFTDLTASSLALNTALTSGDLLDISASTTGIGTVTVTATGTTVSGTSTVFTKQFRVGDTITANTETHTISAIASDTSMTTDAWTNNFGPGAFTLVGGTRWHMASNGNLYANGSVISTSGLTSILTDSSTYTNHNYIGFRINPNLGIVDGVNHNAIGGLVDITVAATVLPTTSSAIGLEGIIVFASTNTQNWTAAIPARAGIFQVSASSGATGTASGTIYGTELILSASTMTWTSAIGYVVNTFSTTSGSIGSAASFASILPTGTVTNYTGLLLGTLTIPTGNYGIYDATGYTASIAGPLVLGKNAAITSGDLFDLYASTNGIGTITVTATGTTVSGTNTVFTRQFRIGDTITANSETHTITAIASDTSLTTDAWTSNFGPGIYTLAGGTRWQFANNGTACINGSAPSAGITGIISDLSSYTNVSYVGIRLGQTFNITDGTNRAVQCIGASASIAVTGSSWGANQVAITGTMTINAANTQNWTGNSNTGTSGSISFGAGSSGTMTGLYALRATLASSANTTVTTSFYGVGISALGTNTGQTITGLASFASPLPSGAGTVTNYTGLLLGTLTIPSGKWGIYDTTSYNWYITGSIINASDRRIKTDIVTIKNGLDLILKLNPVSYSTQTDSRTHFGLIAQEVKEITGDHSIVEFSNDRYGLNYTQFIAPLISSTQTLYNKIKNLEEEIKQLKEKP